MDHNENQQLMQNGFERFYTLIYASGVLASTRGPEPCDNVMLVAGLLAMTQQSRKLESFDAVRHTLIVLEVVLTDTPNIGVKTRQMLDAAVRVGSALADSNTQALREAIAHTDTLVSILREAHAATGLPRHAQN